MIGGYIKNAMQHPAVGAGAGALIGWHAMSGSLFGGLLMAGTIGTYLQARKMQKATDAARAAAIAEAQKCEDVNDPACVARAKRAAVTAGQAALAGGRGALHIPLWASAVIAALVSALIVLAAIK
jgi:hypothetical protein